MVEPCPRELNRQRENNGDRPAQPGVYPLGRRRRRHASFDTRQRLVAIDSGLFSAGSTTTWKVCWCPTSPSSNNSLATNHKKMIGLLLNGDGVDEGTEDDQHAGFDERGVGQHGRLEARHETARAYRSGMTSNMYRTSEVVRDRPGRFQGHRVVA